jgi:hypothetical protein
MRVAYHHELRIRDELIRLGVEHYLPLKWEQRTYAGHLRRVRVPALNIIFVHHIQEGITKMKMYNAELAYLRYIKVAPPSIKNADNFREIVTVPDREMNSFIQATQIDDDRVCYLTYSDFLDKEGRKVRVSAGDFMGVEGEIKRIKKNRCVVVCLRGIAAVAIQVPFENLEFIE